MKKKLEQVVAFIGEAGSGKSALAGLISDTNAQHSVASMSGAIRLPSEQSEYHILNFGGKVFDLTVGPGNRKFWKWTDYVLSDADTAFVFIDGRRYSDSLAISSLIEPVAVMIAFGVSLAGVVVTNCIDSDRQVALIEAVTADLQRVFAEDVVSAVRLFVCLGNVPPTDIRACILSLPVPIRCDVDPFVLSINSVHSKGDSVFLGGKVLTGSIREGDEVTLMPANLPLKVHSLRNSMDEGIESASSGALVGIRVEGIHKKFFSNGMVLVHKGWRGQATRSIEVRVNFFNTSFPVRIGFSPMISILNCQVHGRIFGIEEHEALLGDTATVQISLNKTIYAELAPSRLSRVVLRQENIAIGVGVITRFI